MDWVLNGAGLLSMYIVGSGRKWGWLINLACQPVWVYYSLKTHQYGFLPANILYAILFFRNYGSSVLVMPNYQLELN